MSGLYLVSMDLDGRMCNARHASNSRILIVPSKSPWQRFPYDTMGRSAMGLAPTRVLAPDGTDLRQRCRTFPETGDRCFAPDDRDRRVEHHALPQAKLLAGNPRGIVPMKILYHHRDDGRPVQLVSERAVRDR